MTHRDSIGPASVRSDAYYLLSELIERGGLEEILDGQTGVLLGLALGDLLREGWTILAPPPKVNTFDRTLSDKLVEDIKERYADGADLRPEAIPLAPEPTVSLADEKARARWWDRGVSPVGEKKAGARWWDCG